MRFFSSQGCVSQEQGEEQIFPAQMSGEEASTPRDVPAAHLLPNAVSWLERWTDTVTKARDGHGLPRCLPAKGPGEPLSLTRPVRRQAALGWQRNSAPLMGADQGHGGHLCPKCHKVLRGPARAALDTHRKKLLEEADAADPSGNMSGGDRETLQELRDTGRG